MSAVPREGRGRRPTRRAPASSHSPRAAAARRPPARSWPPWAARPPSSAEARSRPRARARPSLGHLSRDPPAEVGHDAHVHGHPRMPLPEPHQHARQQVEGGAAEGGRPRTNAATSARRARRVVTALAALSQVATADHSAWGGASTAATQSMSKAAGGSTAAVRFRDDGAHDSTNCGDRGLGPNGADSGRRLQQSSRTGAIVRRRSVGIQHRARTRCCTYRHGAAAGRLG